MESSPAAGYRSVPPTSTPPSFDGESIQRISRHPWSPRTAPLPSLHHADDLLSRSSDAGPLPGLTAAQTVQLRQIALWSRDYLTAPHPELGRSGQVCPYVSATLRDRRLLLTLLEQVKLQQREAELAIIGLGQRFLQLEPTAPRSRHRKAIIVLLGDLPEGEAAEVVDRMHQRLKPQFLQHGMMLGEFHSESRKPGLHNPRFRPLRSTIPLLVIRAMVPTDIPFLADQADFVRAFLGNFKAQGCEEVRRYLAHQGAALSPDQSSLLRDEVARCEGTRVSSCPMDASELTRQGG